MSRYFKQLKCLQFRTSRGPTAVVATVTVSLLGLLTVSCGGGSTAVQQPPPPTFTTIDAPGAGPDGTFAFDINASGEVTGIFEDQNGAVHGFIRDATGTLTAFDGPGAVSQGPGQIGTESLGINASGTTVGTFADAQGFDHGFIRTSGGTFTIIDAPGSSTTTAWSINDSGEIAGTFDDVGGMHGFVREADGTFTVFNVGPIAARGFGVTRISESGTVLGSLTDANISLHGYLFILGANGGLGLLDVPGDNVGAESGTLPLDINSSSADVGALVSGLLGQQIELSQSFVRDPMTGTYTVFGPPVTGIQTSQALSINDGGTIVGYYLDANFIRHGYIRAADGGFVTFDDPDAAQLRVSNINEGTLPRRINASGTIVGVFSDAAGMSHGFLRQ